MIFTSIFVSFQFHFSAEASLCMCAIQQRPLLLGLCNTLSNLFHNNEGTVQLLARYLPLPDKVFKEYLKN